MSTKVIDISYHNGAIDFSKVKGFTDNIIIRCGYGSNITSQDDKMFDTYMKNAIANNFRISLYLYSYASNTSDALSEAEHVLRLYKKYSYYDKLSKIVWYDLEEERYKSVSRETFITFATRINSAGLVAGLYTGDSYYRTSKLSEITIGTPIWAARYGNNDGTMAGSKKPSYIKKYCLWQYTSNAKIAGMNGTVDVSEIMDDSWFISNNQPTPEKEMTVDDAIEILHKNNVIASPEYWYNAVKIVNYLGALLVNMAKEFDNG